ncbi:MAG TPA: hypothetical protein VKI41_10835 [Vicinamibacteria bacterium]|nr:hypothetical protein [Vicinamibacteria bacterium]
MASFAGCFDKVLGVEYEDCSFQVDEFSPAITGWFGDTINATVNGNPSRVFRDVEVTQADLRTGKEIVRMAIGHAFLRDFSVSDADASSASLGSLRFVVVPETLDLPPTGSTHSGMTTPFEGAHFDFAVSGVDGKGVAAVRGIHMSAPKIVGGLIGSRRRFFPGAPQFDGIRLEAVSITLGGTTATTIKDLQTWMDNIAKGQFDLRTGDLHFLKPDLTTIIATVRFTDLLPTGFAPFTTRLDERAMDMTVGSILIQ